MPHNPASAKVTERYRKQKLKLRKRAVKLAADAWKDVGTRNVRGSFDAGPMTMLVTQLQRDAARLATGYAAAFGSSELGQPVRPETTMGLAVGRARSGRDLRQAVDGQVAGVLKAIKGGMDPGEAIRRQAPMLERLIAAAVDNAGSEALSAALTSAPYIEGWTRSLSTPSCGACMALAGRTFDTHIPFPVHPSCDCIPEPIIRGAAPHPTGQEVFMGLSRAEQDRSLGPQAAQAIRDGRLQMSDLIDHEPQRSEPTILSQRPVSDLKRRMSKDFSKRMERVGGDLSTDKPQQPIDNMDKLFAQAAATEGDFRAFLDEGSDLEKRLGAEVFHGDPTTLDASQHPQIILAPLKDRAAADRKVLRKHGHDPEFSPEEVTDIVRGTIAVDKLGDLPGLVGELRSFADEKGWQIKGFADRFKDKTNLGYGDLQVELVAPNGHVVELQLNVASMVRAKEGPGRSAYEKWRVLDALPEPTARQRHSSAGLIGYSRRIYAKALAEAKGT